MKIKLLPLLMILVVILCACSPEGLLSDGEKDTDAPNKNASDEIISPEIELPFVSTRDISDSFDEKRVSFDEDKEKMGVICEKMDTASYAQSEVLVTLSDTSPQELIIHCTWLSAARTVYVGLINVVSEEVYTISAVGGALTGTLFLDELPDGEYKVIMYSSDNENIHAVMLYQFK